MQMTKVWLLIRIIEYYIGIGTYNNLHLIYIILYFSRE